MTNMTNILTILNISHLLNNWSYPNELIMIKFQYIAVVSDIKLCKFYFIFIYSISFKWNYLFSDFWVKDIY